MVYGISKLLQTNKFFSLMNIQICFPFRHYKISIEWTNMHVWMCRIGVKILYWVTFNFYIYLMLKWMCIHFWIFKIAILVIQYVDIRKQSICEQVYLYNLFVKCNTDYDDNNVLITKWKGKGLKIMLGIKRLMWKGKG